MADVINEMSFGCKTLQTSAVRVWNHVFLRACEEVSAAPEVSY
jgi:hypothetical protein